LLRSVETLLRSGERSIVLSLAEVSDLNAAVLVL
jgi:hypothetical protein